MERVLGPIPTSMIRETKYDVCLHFSYVSDAGNNDNLVLIAWHFCIRNNIQPLNMLLQQSLKVSEVFWDLWRPMHDSDVPRKSRLKWSLLVS